MIDPPNDSDNVFMQSIAHHSMVNPFQEEGEALRSQPPGQLLSHEKIRLARIDSFVGLFKQAQPPYTAAAKSGNWAKAAMIAHHVASAAKKVVAPLLLLLFLSAQGRAQTLPTQVADPIVAEDLEYLDQQARALAAKVATLPTSTGTATQLTTATMTFTGGSWASTAMGVCSGSTMTITTTATRALVRLAGSAGGNVSEQYGCTFLQDAAFVGDSTRIKPYWHSSISNGAVVGITMEFMTPVLSAGSHSWCVTCAAGSGDTITIPGAGSFTSVAQMTLVYGY